MAQGYYDDARYRTKQILPNAIFGVAKTGSLVGTQAAAVQIGYPYKAMHPIRVISANAYFVVGGTNDVLKLALYKSLAGTGTATAFGTVAVGTTAEETFKDFSLTETSLTTGDTLILQRMLGTSTDVTDVMVSVGVREVFE